MILEPGNYFAIVRQLPDPNDATTYYVQAEIRNAEDDSLIERVQLTDRGDRRFSKRWQVYPAVRSEGMYISILTTVYTDSGYTTKSDNYFEEMNTYQIKSVATHLGGGGGGGSKVDYEKIRKIVEEEVAKIHIDPVDLTPVIEAVAVVARNALTPDTIDGLVQKGIRSIKFPDFPDIPATDMTPVLEAIGSRPVFKETDLKPVMEAIKKVVIPPVDHEKISANVAVAMGEKVMQALSAALKGAETNMAASIMMEMSKRVPAKDEPVVHEVFGMDPAEVIRGMKK